MDYEIIPKKDIPIRKTENWQVIISKLTWDNALAIPCSTRRELRNRRFCLYRAAQAKGKFIETFQQVENGQLILNVWLQNAHSSP